MCNMVIILFVVIITSRIIWVVFFFFLTISLKCIRFIKWIRFISNKLYRLLTKYFHRIGSIKKQAIFFSYWLSVSCLKLDSTVQIESSRLASNFNYLTIWFITRVKFNFLAFLLLFLFYTVFLPEELLHRKVLFSEKFRIKHVVTLIHSF